MFVIPSSSPSVNIAEEKTFVFQGVASLATLFFGVPDKAQQWFVPLDGA